MQTIFALLAAALVQAPAEAPEPQPATTSQQEETSIWNDDRWSLEPGALEAFLNKDSENER